MRERGRDERKVMGMRERGGVREMRGVMRGRGGG